jgi:hypothetical protein
LTTAASAATFNVMQAPQDAFVGRTANASGILRPAGRPDYDKGTAGIVPAGSQQVSTLVSFKRYAIKAILARACGLMGVQAIIPCV